MKFFVERCAGHRLAEWLHQAGHDGVEVRERDADPGDHAVLAWAVSEERSLVTIDTDFGELIFAHSLPHWGLVRLPDVPADQRLALMGQVWAAYSDDLEAKSIVTIRGQRIRISKADST